MLVASPVAPISAPVSRPDQVKPFSEAQITALLEAAKRSHHPKRDKALLLLLLDTGRQASEVCNLRFSDMDLTSKRLVVLGKGNKHRTIFFGRTAAKALWAYVREDVRDKEAPIFVSDRGRSSGEPLTPNGLLQLFWRLGKAARIEAARCSPHTCRHTFAVSFLRNGGNVFSLQQMLGHTALTQTNRYVALAQGDIENQHRAFSPVDHMKNISSKNRKR